MQKKRLAARLIPILIAILPTAVAGWPALPALPAEVHPGLLFTAADIPTLKERIQREPYATWWQTVLERAESTPTTFTEERTRARYAKSLAFAYLMTDDTQLAARAAEVMLEMKFPPRGGDLGEPHNEGEVVAVYAVAYDMLHGYLADSDPAALEEIRSILAEEAERIRKGIVIQEIDLGLTTLKIRLDQTGHLDNWHIRAYGGLGLAAIVLSEHSGINGKSPQQWADKAYDLVTRSLDAQIDPIDGGYAEGPFYSRYAADVYLPYFFALKNHQALDLFSEPLVRKMHDWSLNLRLPSGRRPNIDDGHLDDFYGHYLAAVDADGGAHRWDWENDDNGLYVRTFSEMDGIALYDDGVTAREPERGPTLFMPGAGDAVFRSDWSADGVYLLLRGEHGLMREKGLAHEHPDETSVILYAYGEMLAVDAGYINFSNHNKVNEGHNHSLVLVDGQGPPVTRLLGEPFDVGKDAYIENYFTTPFLDYAEVRAAYAGVEIRRRVLFAYHSFFLVADEIRGDREHLYEWRLHGNGGGTSGGTYERTGNLARWQREKADLFAFLPEREGRTFSERDTIHSFDYLQELTHTALRVEQRGTDAEFLAVLYPNPAFRVQADYETLEAGNSQAVQIFGEGVLDVAWIQAAASDSVALETHQGRLESDGRFGFASYPETVLRRFAVQDGRFLRADGKELFRASSEIDVAWELADNGGLSGFVRGPEEGFTLSISVEGELEELSFDGSPIDSTPNEGILIIELAGEGDLLVELASGSTDPEEKTADFDGDGTVGFDDFFLFADAFGQSATGDLARFDLSGDTQIGFDDFFLFADAFGRPVTP